MVNRPFDNAKFWKTAFKKSQQQKVQLLDEIQSLTAQIEAQQATRSSVKRKADAQPGNKANIQTKRQQLKQRTLPTDNELDSEPPPGEPCALNPDCFH
jgi:chromosome segregation ATPase